MAQAEQRQDVVVIGAGAAGIGVASELRGRETSTLVLERSDRVGSRWLERYQGLRLNTVRQLSGFRSSPIPRHAGRWVDRREFARYLERSSKRAELEVRHGVEVRSIEREGNCWAVVTSQGAISSRCVVVATGHDAVAKLPPWPGRDGFEGDLLHSSQYKNASAYERRDVLVVGPGNSGSEIATQLAAAGARRVRLAVRTPVNLMPATILGVPSTWFARVNETGSTWLVDVGSRLVQRLAFGDLERHGMGKAPLGVATELRERGLGPVLDRGFVAALKVGKVEIVPAVQAFDGPCVLLDGEKQIAPDVVIAATGYRPGLESLVGHLGILEGHGLPPVVDGRHEIEGAAGIYFNGYWLPLSGQLPAMRRSSRRIARMIASRLAA